MLTNTVLLCLAAAASREDARPDVEAVEAALRELRSRAARYESVEAHFRVDVSEDAELELRALSLYFAAPDRIHLRLRSVDGEGSIGFQEGRLTMRASGPDAPSLDMDASALVELSERVSSGLDELFPDPDRPHSDSVVLLDLRLQGEAGAGKSQLSFHVAFSHAGPFGWLFSVRPEHAIALDDERITFHKDAGELVLSRLTGLIERIGNERATFVLERASIDEPIDPQAFEQVEPDSPAQAPSAEELASAERSFARQMWGAQRAFAWRCVARSFRDRTDFEARALELFGSLLAWLFDQELISRPSGVDDLLEKVAEAARREREAAQGDPEHLARLAERIAGTRETLAAKLGQTLDSWRPTLVPPPGEEPEIAEALSALEWRALSELYAERVLAPALERYDEVTAE